MDLEITPAVMEVRLSHSAENVYRCAGDEDKENKISSGEPECEKAICFKLPTSLAPRVILSPLKDDTNTTRSWQSSNPSDSSSQDLICKSPKNPAKAYGRHMQGALRLKSLDDDGFLERLETEEELVEGLAVPKGLEGLFFFPVIEGNEGKASLVVQEPVSLKEADDTNGEVASPAAQDIRIPHKRSESHESNLTPLQLKRRRGLVEEKERRNKEDATGKQATPRRITRCHSETEIFIKTALSWADSQQNLIGDFSKPFCLPLVNGKHHDLRAISPETMAAIVDNVYKDVMADCVIIDCRYPYEFNGGHIKGARNIYTAEDLVNIFFTKRIAFTSTNSTTSNISFAPSSRAPGRTILVFHCEFSSERGPKLYRFLRNHDRDTNVESYPALFYPEIYLLEGGYRAYYEKFPNLCQPQGYVPMLQQDHLAQLKQYRTKVNALASTDKTRVVRYGAATRPSFIL